MITHVLVDKLRDAMGEKGLGGQDVKVQVGDRLLELDDAQPVKWNLLEQCFVLQVKEL